MPGYGTLRIQLFGGVRVERNIAGRGEPIPLPRHLQLLLCFLLCHRGQRLSREVLIETFWPDMEAGRGRRCLNSAIHRLRDRLTAPEGHRNAFIATPAAEEVEFRPTAPYWLDVEEFETCAKRCLDRLFDNPAPEQIAELEHAVSLYHGDILSGIYDEWAILERERLKNWYLDVLYGLTMHHADNLRLDKAARYGREVLRHDGLREDVHRTLMRICMAGGDRSGAMRQYAECRELLRRELAIEPMPETQDLYRELCAGAPMAAGRVPRNIATTTMGSARERFRSVRERIARLRLSSNRFQADVDEIERGITSLEHMSSLPKTDH